jgi:CIC family chloride channel protein
MLGGVLAEIFHQPQAGFVIVGMAAVFAGAARVPIATLLMVTEMTGGYKLLVPAALAITVSYLTQGRFARSLKYISLYEGQVDSRPDSPAHYAEHLETAIRLLALHKVTVPETISHIKLSTLFDAGIPIDLPKNRRLLMAKVKEDSHCIGERADVCFPVENEYDIDLVAVFRGTQIPEMLLPTPKTVVQVGDRLLLIAKSDVWEKYENCFD